MAIILDRIDHVVIHCREAEATLAGYERVLGRKREVFGPNQRICLKFGEQKFKMRPTGALRSVYFHDPDG